MEIMWWADWFDLSHMFQVVHKHNRKKKKTSTVRNANTQGSPLPHSEISKTRKANLCALLGDKCCLCNQQVFYLDPKWMTTAHINLINTAKSKQKQRYFRMSTLQLILSATNKKEDILELTLPWFLYSFSWQSPPRGCVCRHRHHIDATCSNRRLRLPEQMSW